MLRRATVYVIAVAALAMVCQAQRGPVRLTVTASQNNVPAGVPVQCTALKSFFRAPASSGENVTTSVDWTSSDRAVAMVDVSGAVTTRAAGTTLIQAKNGPFSAAVTLTVLAPVLRTINVQPATPSIAKGFMQQFHAIGTYSDGSSLDITNSVTWNSVTQSVATIASSSGLATGVGVGSSTISATDPTTLVKGVTTLSVTSAVLQNITVSPRPNPNLPVGLQLQFSALGGFSDGTTQDITNQVSWSTSAPSVAGIFSTGLASGLAQGTTTINATHGSISDTAPPLLTVTSATLKSLNISPANASLAAGFNAQYRAIGTYSDGSTFDLTSQVAWSTGSSAIATINSLGNAHAVAVGTTTVIASLGNISASTNLTVTSALLQSISVAPSNPNVPKGTTQPYTATGHFSDGSTLDVSSQVTWIALDNTIAIINQSGLATGIGQGSTTIEAISGSITGTATITVTAPALVSVAVSPADVILAVGAVLQYNATGHYSDGSTADLTSQVTWSSTTANASIDAAGVATAVSPGGTSIQAALGTITGSTQLEVIPVALVSIAIEPINQQIPNGFTQQYSALGSYNNGTSKDITTAVNWTSTNTAAATIGLNTGLATSKGVGNTTIMATDPTTGVNNSTMLTISSAVLQTMTVTPNPPANLPIGAKMQFTATGGFSDGTFLDLTNSAVWSTSAPNIAMISTTGLATGVSAGTSVINATVNGISDTLPPTLTVTTATVTSITVTPANASFAAGLKQQYSAIALYSDGTTLDVSNQATWGSSNPGAATVVSTTGLVTTVAPGTTTIQATFMGVSGSTGLTVTGATLVSIAITPANPSVPLGSSQQFTATGTFSDGSTAVLTNQVNWVSSDTSIAVITPGGFATTVAVGSTQIEASLNGVLGTTTLTVTQPNLVTIAVSPANPLIPVGKQLQMTATGIYSNNSRQDITTQVTWSDNNGKVSITSTGLATGVSKGKTFIRATLGAVVGQTKATVQ